ncbi:glycoside hydrolase family 16 protein [Karstenula rhodostoma CBS 690.94]|uniref:Glycoside hydrolase family 16 protein n=1 Tax=Karstenula rhodostoma CBS 690.94 TaxID=1392251 RepID=A0A9P4PPX9_9PLEO|nr:glycoside hydrolase family 16 protein [Karstenula rhodostoma CBS 690.94]
MMYTSNLILLASLAIPSLAAYQPVWDINASHFFDNFTFVNSPDTFTNGFTQYVGIDEALSSGLAKINNGKVRLGVDSKNTYSTTSSGRKSLRLQSYGWFDNGLLVADFNHVPVAGCGMWPAFWVYQGEQQQGSYAEIDILENVNVHTANTHSFYTSEKCTINVQKGNLVPEKTTDCTWKSDGPSSQGCSFNAEEGTFNQPFNDQYRVVALQVESERIRIWHFKKTEVPADLSSANPNPDAWTKAPTVHITPKSCDFHKAFNHFYIIINITFCGSWAGDDFSNTNYAGQCKAKTGTSDCKSWVAGHPTDFTNTYFEFNSIKLFQRG